MINICHNSHNKLTKSEIESSWSGFKHCSKAYMKSYLVIIGPIQIEICFTCPYLALLTYIYHYLSIFGNAIWCYVSNTYRLIMMSDGGMCTINLQTYSEG